MIDFGTRVTVPSTRESSETDKREYDLYYRYFMDDYEKILYLPEPGQNGTNVYYAHWEDENSKCHKEGPYTEDVMHAMAGLSTVEENRNLNIEANPNIRQLGIQTEIDNRVDDATNGGSSDSGDGDNQNNAGESNKVVEKQDKVTKTAVEVINATSLADLGIILDEATPLAAGVDDATVVMEKAYVIDCTNKIYNFADTFINELKEVSSCI